jgi:succinate-semialdehyde dehydrogenase/glutarate-semialdehyde dehydrogenase
MAIETVNPATEEIVKSFTPMTDEEVKIIIDDVNTDFLNWKTEELMHRKSLMLNAAKILKNEKMKYAEILTLEMGKPITQAIAEVEKCAWVCEYYAENTESILAKEFIETDATESYVQFDPIGIVLAVMPWNFPFWQVFRFAAPALMAGNAGILKHASNVPMSALAIEEIFQKAGFPKNLFRTLIINSNQVDSVLENPKVKASTLTGSEYAGSMVASKSGKMLKKSVMELGGSDPFIVLKDADIDLAVQTATTARLLNNGQSCIAAKRFIVVEEIAEEFEKKFVNKFEQVVVGDPMDEKTELGPIAREDLLFELHEQVEKSVENGAKILTGGKRIDRKGYYYSPTILTDVAKGMLAYDQELFGPVATIIKVKDEEEAIFVANDTPFGLGSSLWTNDLTKAKMLAKEIESGSVFINGMVKSDPRLPFGGVKLSGFGRELSHYGIKEFVNIKTVWVK